MNTNTRNIYIGALVAAGGLIGFLIGSFYNVLDDANTQQQHDLLAKRIFITNRGDTLVNFEPLRESLRKDLAYYDGAVSLYFEYLFTGTSISIGDREQMTAASMLKVPVVMETYKLIEQYKLRLNTPVTIKQEWLDSQYGELYKKGAGHQTTIEELIKQTLIRSDNTALNALQAIVKEKQVRGDTDAFASLDIHFTDSDHTDLALSARSYASFLKCLYFACYVSPDSSQQILGYLTQSTNGSSGRLNKYIPKNTRVAHKIGISGEQTQADCGIVYIPNRNYLICMMINESKVEGSEVIAQTSKLIYDYVQSR